MSRPDSLSDWTSVYGSRRGVAGQSQGSWPVSAGMGSRFTPESVAELPRATHKYLGSSLYQYMGIKFQESTCFSGE